MHVLVVFSQLHPADICMVVTVAANSTNRFWAWLGILGKVGQLGHHPATARLAKF